jgi:hypothetical protein
MKRTTALICTGMIAASCAFAQTAPPATAPANGTAAPARQRPQQTPEQIAAAKANADALNADHQNMMDQLHITSLRPGKNGTDTAAANFTNYDESKANPYPVWPDPLTFKDGKKVKTPADWAKRRKEIVEDFDREVYGRVPKNVPKVTWSVFKDTDEVVNGIAVNLKQLKGHVDNSSYPAINVDIQLTLTVPKSANHPVPVIMVFGGGDFLNPRPAGAGFGFGPPRAGAAGARPAGPPQKNAEQQILEKGWAYATLNPGSIQADNGNGLTKGIIGLVNKGQYRKPDDWGALRAWAWGADRALDYFETNPAVNAKEVAIEGHSRYGKGALVTLAYDQRMATAYVSSSGEAGAKPSRRNIGEVVENITGNAEYHWMAGNFLKYGGPLTWNDLPVDAHELIALCAPRPVFISGGKMGNGGVDAWVDARGMFMAADAAGPVYTLLGKQAISVHQFPKMETLLDGDVAFRQHSSGHTDVPNWPYFLTFADKYFK